MDHVPPDPRTAARVAAIRAGCTLPVARVYGSLEGRADGEVRAAAIEPDGRHAALVLRDAVERWDLDALACVGRWEVPALDVYTIHAVCVAPAPGGLRVLNARGLWRVNDAGNGWQVLVPSDGRSGNTQSAGDSFAMWRDGDLHILLCEDGTTRWTATAPAAWIDVVFSPCGRFLLRRASATSFDVLEAVALGAGTRVELRPVARLATTAPAVRNVTFGALDGERRLAAIATSEGVVLGRWDEWWSAATVTARAERLRRLAFTAGGHALILGEVQRLAWIDVAKRELRVPRGASGTVGGGRATIAVSASGRVLCVPRSCLHVFDVGSDGFRARAFDPVGEFASVAGTPDGRALLTAATDGAIRVRDRATGEVLAQAEAGGPVRSVAASPDGREVLALRADREILRYDRATGSLVARVARVGKPLWLGANALVVSPDGRFAVLVPPHDRRTMVRVDLVTGAVHPFEPPEGLARDTPAATVAFTAEGALRCVYMRRSDARPRDAVVVEYAPGEGHAREIFERPYYRLEEIGDLDSFQHLLSRDGRQLWRIASGNIGLVVSVFAVDAPTRDEVRWAFRFEPYPHCVGIRLPGFSTGRRGLLLLAAHGAVVRSPWPRGCVPLAFAPDDGALWVRDASGLVVELTVPAELRADP